MKKNNRIISLYSFGHFIVDFVCALVLAAVIFRNPESIARIAGIILAYNVVAFGLQPFLGIFIDKYRIARQSASIGLAIAAIGMLFFSRPLAAALILGFGNALYHVGGGIVALNLDSKRAKYPGIFVSTGALGLLAGGLLGYSGINPTPLVALGIALCIMVALFIMKTDAPRIKKVKSGKVNWSGIGLLLLLVSICTRSIMGYVLRLDWKSLLIFSIIFSFCVAAGKFAGGILADRFGFRKTGVICLIAAAPFLVFFQDSPLAIFIGIFCFNIAMPITLTAVANMMPNNKGFAFGLTTLALVFGYLLFVLLKNYVQIGTVLALAVMIINIASLYFGIGGAQKVKSMSKRVQKNIMKRHKFQEP